MFRKLELKRFGDDQLAELSHARFLEAKKRLRNFVINTETDNQLNYAINLFQS